MFETIVVLTYVYSEPSTGNVFLVLFYHIIQRYNTMKIPLNYVSLVLLVLFKVTAFSLKNRKKTYFPTRQRQLVLYAARRHACLFCFEAICHRYLRTALN